MPQAVSKLHKLLLVRVDACKSCIGFLHVSFMERLVQNLQILQNNMALLAMNYSFGLGLNHTAKLLHDLLNTLYCCFEYFLIYFQDKIRKLVLLFHLAIMNTLRTKVYKHNVYLCFVAADHPKPAKAKREFYRKKSHIILHNPELLKQGQVSFMLIVNIVHQSLYGRGVWAREAYYFVHHTP